MDIFTSTVSGEKSKNVNNGKSLRVLRRVLHRFRSENNFTQKTELWAQLMPCVKSNCIEIRNQTLPPWNPWPVGQNKAFISLFCAHYRKCMHTFFIKKWVCDKLTPIISTRISDRHVTWKVVLQSIGTHLVESFNFAFDEMENGRQVACVFTPNSWRLLTDWIRVY
jgi:hypothetical protein